MITYGFSIQGKGHIQRGIVCQDSSIVDRIKSGHYVGIVADGVGSARHADVGQPIDNIKTGFFPFYEERQGVVIPVYAPEF